MRDYQIKLKIKFPEWNINTRIGKYLVCFLELGRKKEMKNMGKDKRPKRQIQKTQNPKN